MEETWVEKWKDGRVKINNFKNGKIKNWKKNFFQENLRNEKKVYGKI